MSRQSSKTAREKWDTAAAPDERKTKRKKPEHPLASLSGIFKDDPLWDEYIDAVRRARAEEDAKTDVPG